MAENSTPPDPFPDPDAPDVTVHVNATLPGSVGGPIESMKRAMMVALREALTGMSLALNSSEIKVSMEYPMTKALNPGIWVQFSFTDINRAGIDHEVYVKVEGVWTPIQEWIYYGRLALTIVAYTNVERDRLSDAFINNIAFARTPDLVLTKPNEDTKQFRSLIGEINKNPYVSLTVNTDSLSSGQQGTSVGTPWDDNQFVHEDNYSFDVVGQFNFAFRHDGSYELARIDIDATPDQEPPEEGWSAWV